MMFIPMDVCEMFAVYSSRRQWTCNKAKWTRAARKIYRVMERHGLSHVWLRVSRDELLMLRSMR